MTVGRKARPPALAGGQILFLFFLLPFFVICGTIQSNNQMVIKSETAHTEAPVNPNFWQRRRTWITTMISHGFPFRIKGEEFRLLMKSDAEFAQTVRIPEELVASMRRKRAFFIALPVGQEWVLTFTNSPDFGKSKEAIILKTELIKLAEEIAGAVATGSPSTDLFLLQQEAYLIYSKLPKGMREELAQYYPAVVTNARQGENP